MCHKLTFDHLTTHKWIGVDRGQVCDFTNALLKMDNARLPIGGRNAETDESRISYFEIT